MRLDVIEENLKGYISQEMIDRIKFNETLRNLVEERMNDEAQYQPMIRHRGDGFLDMRDEVDKIRDREYHIYKSLLDKSKSVLLEVEKR